MHQLTRRVGSGLGRGAAALGVALGLLSCSGAHEPRRLPPPEAVPARVAPTANVPALLGVSIDGLRQRLGPPQELPEWYANSGNGALLYAAGSRYDSLLTFRTGGLVVLATYNARSRQVRDLLLLGHHEDSLMGRARLRAGAANYLIMPVFRDGRSFRLLGLRVIPTH